MYCKSCGKEVDDGILMCPYCGCDLSEEEENCGSNTADESENVSESNDTDMAEELAYENNEEGNEPENKSIPDDINEEKSKGKNKIESSVNLIKWLMCGGVFCLVMLIAATAGMNYCMWKEISKINNDMNTVPKFEYYTKSYFPEESHSRSGDDFSQTSAYSTIKIDTADLAKMGREGWEIAASYLENETAWPNFGNNDYVTGLQPNVRPQKLVVIFKRQIN